MGKVASRTGRRIAVLGVVLGLVLAGAAAQAQAVAIRELQLPLVGTRSPNHITAGAEGNLWISGHNEASIDRVTPEGDLTEFFVTPNTSPEAITVGPNGKLWFTEQGFDRIGRLSPAGSLTEFASNGITGQTAGIVLGPEGNLWFTQHDGVVGRITTAGSVTEFSAGISGSANGIALGPDGNLWFTEESKIGRITPDGVVTEFSEGMSPDSEAWGIALGPDGNLWFTERGTDRIGRITPDGVVTEFSEGITPGSEPLEIAAGPDGNLWFTERAGARVGRITPNGVVTEFSQGISPGSAPSGIAAGPDDSMWFTEQAGRIGQVMLSAAAPPTAVTEAASSVTTTSATLNATVNPNGSSASDCYFEYGSSEFYGSRVPCAALPGAGSGAVPVVASVANLTEGTAYHVRIVATNAGGTSYGADRTFTTSAQLPPPPPPQPPGGMWVGLTAGGWGPQQYADVANAVSYVRLADAGREVPEWTRAGVKVIDDIEGPYNSGGISALNQAQWVANAVAAVAAHPEIAAVEVGNEVYGSWFWGSNAESQQNATAYAELLKAVHTAFVAAFGSARPLILASDTYQEGSRWNGEVFGKSGALEDVDGIVVHPYGGTAERSESALGHRDEVEGVHAADKKPVYITEIGWPTCVVAGCATHTGDSLEWTQQEQATNLYNFITWARRTGYVRDVTIYNYRDNGPISAGDEYGIEETEQSGGVEGGHKLSYTALQEAAHEQACTVCN